MNNKTFDITRIFFLTVSLALIATSLLLPDQLGSIIWGALIILALTVLDIQVPKITKLSDDNPKVQTMRRLNRLLLFVLVIVSVLNLFGTFSDSQLLASNELIPAVIISLLIMVLGNSMPKLPFNRYMGLRLPWTIRDEDTWRVAHRLSGYLAFPCGIFMLIGSFWLPIKTVAVTSILTWVFIPGIYSLWFYYRKFKH